MADPRPRILWGLTASVAAIRAPLLAAELAKVGELRIVVTERTKHFLADLSTDAPIADDAAEWSAWSKLGDPVLHIELRRWADVFLIAPLSADALARICHGMADSLLLSVARAWDFSKPMLVAPAMNTLMWEHPVTASQLSVLQSWGAGVVPPIEKRLACDDVGMGAMALPPTIADAVRDVLQQSGVRAVSGGYTYSS